ncbi:MAG: S-methyl-5-thioribose-1-phosphate isomerase, partial [Mailhella sp.]|nr:S-methyl-5-thioribose-1-phosphate isomerase [Mailhella sp.]
GVPIHVWVDETRPRGQGAALTSWELLQHGVPHDVIADNAGGHLMQRGMVDMVITGADRVARSGDTANKIGTYLKALAAADSHVPFYVALPSSTFDFCINDGLSGIPIEERSPDEVLYAYGALDTGEGARVRLCPPGAAARNWAFDVTPARLITGFITERGICAAEEDAISAMYPEAAAAGTGERRHA